MSQTGMKTTTEPRTLNPSLAQTGGFASASMNTSPDAFFDTVYDLIVFGAGYAGFGALQSAAKAGKRVLLVDPRCDLLWESSRTFHAASGPWTPRFGSFGRTMAIVTGIGDGTIDGGQAEWAANEVLRDAGTPRLYYATPVAIERTGDLIESVTVACPEGLRRLVARQWIDATEEGRLARLCGTAQSPRPPARRLAYVMLQRREWPGGETVPVPLTEFPDVRAVWQASHWTAERALRIEAPGCGTPPLSALLTSGLAALRKLIGTTCDDAFVSHASYTFYPEYEAGTAAASPAANLALAVPGLAQQPVRTLCDRYELGCAALARIAGQPCAAAGLRPTPPTPPKPEDVLEAPVVVAGLGTAGALAAIAAGRSGARVLAFEEQPFPGGVAVACCIHAYYYGCPGGLQEEIDDEVAKLMPLFARRKEWPAGYHPHARRAVLERLLAAADVETHYGCRLVEVTCDGGRIIAATVATPDGIRTVRAEAWIDATGEATLCHTAGVPSRLGRASDGNLHVYTQSCSAYSYREHQFTAFINNSDTGFVDPNDARDMTRARIEGLHDYKLQVTNAFNRATGMVPAIGIRQGRLVATDYRLTLDDLLERRRFDDAIGFTGGHYDNHADDFFAESDAAAMLVWGAGCWGARTACEIPYRALLPQGLDNLWLACRAAGGTFDASMGFRMQRDMHRLGEAAGIAAALAVQHGTTSRAIPFEELRQALLRSGALQPPLEDTHNFGRAVSTLEGDAVLNGPATESNIRAWIKALATPQPGLALWRLYRLGPQKTRHLIAPLLRPRAVAPATADAAYHAALLCCAWGDAAGERILKATVARRGPSPGGRQVPRSWAAAWALGCGGTPRAWRVLAEYAADAANPAAARLTAADACVRIAQRHTPRPADSARMARMLPKLEGCHHRLRPWQADFIAERVRIAFGLPRDPALVQAYTNDPSLIVRRAFAERLAGAKPPQTADG
jgi:hypothetical protein